ncbi:hypothetical protein NUU61_001699 [Penicillium alfredii]|uniref:DUF4048 domain-containing protein n=1 Tax=Penicillium alfredii TaxID=1506179 RepID=A0A9W9FQ85_9EURO|nr:uncharacterized protein NUU61_001699 [Penicillium alfredii]KAJ5104352.1 hypothetical protein NUU61_001699 [Penicillium alfredii]
MESSPGTDGVTHGPPPDASQTSPSPPADSPTQPEPASESPHPSLSRSEPFSQQKRFSLPPRANPAARHSKRLTLNFPVNLALNQPAVFPSDPSVSSPGSMTPITQSSTRPSPALPAGTPMPFDGPDDSYDFLRAIASQDRKVMELREELHRAEIELEALKKQWAQAEKSRKRTQINYQAEQMKPLRSPDQPGPPDGASLHRREQSISSVGSSSVSQERRSRELEQRSSLRAAATAGSKISANGRRVFQGSHTRALSLLTPATVPGIPQRGDAAPSPLESNPLARAPRSATLPSLERNKTSSIGTPVDDSHLPEHLLTHLRNTVPPPSGETIMRTGKQMASDLREGLWTFLEDLRQVTVGEDAVNGVQNRTMSPSRSLAPPNGRKRNSSAHSRSRDRLSVAGDRSSRSSGSSQGRAPAPDTISGKTTKPEEISTSFWDEFGVDKPAQKPQTARHTNDLANRPSRTDDPEHRGRPTSRQADKEDDTVDDWDDWDAPQSEPKVAHTPSSSRSTVESSKHDQSPITQGSSPRTSASFGDTNPSITAPDQTVPEGLPWPAISKLTPSKLQRTASTLMAEWERSISPSPERSGSLSRSRSKSSKAD